MLIFSELCLRIFIWIGLEIVLNLAGIDNLADYSEFILSSKINLDEVSIAAINDLLVDRQVTSIETFIIT